jgi:hypothetical protein
LTSAQQARVVFRARGALSTVGGAPSSNLVVQLAALGPTMPLWPLRGNLYPNASSKASERNSKHRQGARQLWHRSPRQSMKWTQLEADNAGRVLRNSKSKTRRSLGQQACRTEEHKTDTVVAEHESGEMTQPDATRCRGSIFTLAPLFGAVIRDIPSSCMFSRT